VTPLAEQIVRLVGPQMALDEALVERLEIYLGLLAKWNKTVNLTGFGLDPPSDDAVMRLVVEPVIVAELVKGFRAALDVGSGGGSPALPLKLALPEMRFILVESKSRKCAFLREAVRHLELDGVEVVNSRLEDLTRSDPKPFVDLVTVRAVRLDGDLWAAIRALLLPQGGAVLHFGSLVTSPEWPEGFRATVWMDIASTATRIALGTCGGSAD
jgi:16S rRNA (guanine527-N7)-methyltransferase